MLSAPGYCPERTEALVHLEILIMECVSGGQRRSTVIIWRGVHHWGGKRPSVLVADQWIPKPGLTMSGSRRGGARRGGGAGPGRTGRRQNGSPRRKLSLVPPKASKTHAPNAPPEARTSEIQFKPMGEHNERLACGTTAALRSWLLTSGPPPCLCKPFSCKACLGKIRTNHGWVGSGRRTAGRGGARPGRTSSRRIGSPTKKPSFAPSRASNTHVLNVPPDARTSEIRCKPVGELLYPRWTAVDQRLITAASAGRRPLFVLAADQWTDAFLSM